MKKILLLMAMAITAVAFTGCSSEDEEGTWGPPTKKYDVKGQATYSVTDLDLTEYERTEFHNVLRTGCVITISTKQELSERLSVKTSYADMEINGHTVVFTVKQEETGIERVAIGHLRGVAGGFSVNVYYK